MILFQRTFNRRGSNNNISAWHIYKRIFFHRKHQIYNRDNGNIELNFNDEFHFVKSIFSKFYVMFVLVAEIAQYESLSSNTMIWHKSILQLMTIILGNVLSSALWLNSLLTIYSVKSLSTYPGSFPVHLNLHRHHY